MFKNMMLVRPASFPVVNLNSDCSSSNSVGEHCIRPGSVPPSRAVPRMYRDASARPEFLQLRLGAGGKRRVNHNGGTSLMCRPPALLQNLLQNLLASHPDRAILVPQFVSFFFAVKLKVSVSAARVYDSP